MTVKLHSYEFHTFICISLICFKQSTYYTMAVETSLFNQRLDCYSTSSWKVLNIMKWGTLWKETLKRRAKICNDLPMIQPGFHNLAITWHQNKLPIMMTSSIGNIFHVIGPLCGEFTGHRWIPLTRDSDAGLWYFLWSAPEKRLSKQSWGWWFGTLSRLSWCQCNDWQ